MGRFQMVPYDDFQGLNEDEDPHVLAPNELTIAKNVWGRGRTIGTRPGTEREASGEAYENNIGAAKEVQGLVEYRRANDATRTLVAVVEGDIYTDDTTTITGTVNITAGTANKWTFAQYDGNVYGAGGAGTDDLWKWTGTGNAAQVGPMQDLTPANIFPTYIFQKWNRLWTCQFRDAAGALATDLSSNPMVIRFSELGDGDTWPVGNSIGGTSGIGAFSAYGDEYTTGFADFTDNRGDWLLVLTNKRIYTVSQTGDYYRPFITTERGAIANGCVHQNAFVNLGLDSSDGIYLSRQGIHSIQQSQQFGALQDTFLSWKIRNTFATINQTEIKRAVGTYWREEGLVLFAVPTGSNTFNDTILALDLKGIDKVNAENAKWYIWKRGGSSNAQIAINAFAPARDENDTWYIYAGNEDGDIIRFTENTTSDLGTGYTVQFRTSHFDFGRPGTRKGLGNVFVEVQPGGNYNPVYRPVFDFGRREGSALQLDMPAVDSQWDNFNWDDDPWSGDQSTVIDKLYVTGSGETIAHDLTHSGANEPFYVTKIAAQVRTWGESIGETD